MVSDQWRNGVSINTATFQMPGTDPRRNRVKGRNCTGPPTMDGEFLAPARRVSFFLWQDTFANLRSVCSVVIDADEATEHTLHISESILTGDRLQGLAAVFDAKPRGLRYDVYLRHPSFRVLALG